MNNLDDVLGEEVVMDDRDNQSVSVMSYNSSVSKSSRRSVMSKASRSSRVSVFERLAASETFSSASMKGMIEGESKPKSKKKTSSSFFERMSRTETVASSKFKERKKTDTPTKPKHKPKKFVPKEKTTNSFFDRMSKTDTFASARKRGQVEDNPKPPSGKKTSSKFFERMSKTETFSSSVNKGIIDPHLKRPPSGKKTSQSFFDRMAKTETISSAKLKDRSDNESEGGSVSTAHSKKNSISGNRSTTSLGSNSVRHRAQQESLDVQAKEIADVPKTVIADTSIEHLSSVPYAVGETSQNNDVTKENTLKIEEPVENIEQGGGDIVENVPSAEEETSQNNDVTKENAYGIEEPVENIIVENVPSAEEETSQKNDVVTNESAYGIEEPVENFEQEGDIVGNDPPAGLTSSEQVWEKEEIVILPKESAKPKREPIPIQRRVATVDDDDSFMSLESEDDDEMLDLLGPTQAMKLKEEKEAQEQQEMKESEEKKIEASDTKNEESNGKEVELEIPVSNDPQSTVTSDDQAQGYSLLFSEKFKPTGGMNPLSLEELGLTDIFKSFEAGTVSNEQLALAVIEATFNRDFIPGKHWVVDSASAREPAEDEGGCSEELKGRSFVVKKQATWDHKDIYSVAAAKGELTIW
eukprot:CAMPEP_0184859010 /NCGR_PEP_ID=MMETSP0580-20130426/4030_1 /TAXON_ID=1118495 /ORGANISM="Dactyliosolen fragilissimus" /LENGTH=639 /DNA_ID=CAMNT_0027355413 /DNA_START=75 /DNA_END=1991 /DNA_ORIENTATION=+